MIKDFLGEVRYKALIRFGRVLLFGVISLAAVQGIDFITNTPELIDNPYFITILTALLTGIDKFARSRA